MDTATETFDDLIRSAARRLKGHQRRLFQAEVATRVCDGSARKAERRFGWGRNTVDTGLHEAQRRIRCVEDFVAKGRVRAEDKDPKLAADIRAIAEPHTQTDPELKTARRYTNLSAAEVRQALLDKGHAEGALPAVRTLRDVLNRMGYRLRRIRKGKPLKKTKDTDAIFANVEAVRQAVKGNPEVLEISIDTKAKVAVGDYSRGGKNPDRLGRQGVEGLGP